MNDDRDEYLWDKSGPPDPEVAALESELARQRWSGRLPAAPLPARAPRAAWRPALAASLAAAALFGGALWAWSRGGSAHVAPAQYLAQAEAPVYRAEALAGALSASEFRDGERLVTDATTRARVEVGDIGSLVVEPDSVVRVERPGPALAADAEHLLWLERGAVTASIFAAPRLFQLGTPGGLAVDLGCVYTARVQDDGTTSLSVVAGQVSFEAEQRRVTVPSGASTVSRPGRGP
ncbi:MAG: FecR domain-containing protein, partial [Planctomycetes bacterium]|nr:FecR domain-containing protein [Planctomycetota bacterium]